MVLLLSYGCKTSEKIDCDAYSQHNEIKQKDNQI